MFKQLTMVSAKSHLYIAFHPPLAHLVIYPSKPNLNFMLKFDEKILALQCDDGATLFFRWLESVTMFPYCQLVTFMSI